MASRGRARGRGDPTTSRGASSGRGRGFSTAASSTPRAPSGRGNAAGIAHPNGLTKARNRNSATSAAQSRGSWPERYEKLERARKAERLAAIKNGEMQDPDKPRALAEAITPVGTCPDMCAEFERVERVVQKDVWAEETDPTKSAYSTLDREPDEARMVKKFRRSAAGIEEQLPSDLRPPHVLKRTCDYLFNEVIGNAADLGKVHHFVWDRTRAIRNDFSIQQIRDADGLRLAVDCYERIARFHILSLHQLALPETPYFKYDWQQEREQLDRTLLSLIQYYDDSRDKIDLPNESEFREYLVIFQLQDPIPDLEDRVQTWPSHIIQHPRIRKALKLYAAACNTKDVQGPLKPQATHVIAQQDWQRFWNLVSSTRTSYLAACVAEIYFNMIRSMVLQGLLRSSNQKSLGGDYTVDEMCSILAYDTEEELEEFLRCYNIALTAGPDGQLYADFSALKGRQFLPSPSPALPKQMKTELVEEKRFGRSFPAVISGLSVKQAQEAGMVIDEEMADDYETLEDTAEEAYTNGNGFGHDNDDADNDGESLFLPDTAKPKVPAFGLPSSGDKSYQAPTSVFEKPVEQQKPSAFGFGQPSNATGSTTVWSTSPFAPAARANATQGKPKFNFLSNGTPTDPASTQPADASSNVLGLFSKPPAEQRPAVSPISGFGALSTGTAAPDAGKTATTPPFGGFKPPTFNTPFNDANDNRNIPSFAPQVKTSPSGPFVQEIGDGLSNVRPTTNSSGKVTEKPAASSFSFTEPTENASKPTAPSFAFTKSGGSEAEAKSLPTLHFVKTAGPEKSAPASPSFAPIQAETSQTAPPHQSAFNFTPPPEPASPSADKSLLASAPRRTSGVDYSSKPAKPSPLAHSFTFGSETAVESINDAQPQAKKNNQGATQQKQLSAPKPAPVPDFSSIITRIARDITLDPVSGLLDQYVDYTVRNLITDVQEILYLERINAEATAFRLNTLSKRYGLRWRSICHHKRLVNRGRDKRRRAQQRLAESRNGADTNSLAESIRSRAESHLSSVLGGRQSRQEIVDKMFQSSSGNGRWATKAREDQARGGSKRPTSSHTASASPGPHINGHKRLKSTSYVDDSGRVAKPSPTSHPVSNTLQRASFLGSMTGLAPPALSTQTNYFRLKAAGRSTLGNNATGPSRKRQHSELSTPQPADSPSAPVAGLPSQSGSPASAGHYHQRQASTASNKSQKVDEEDDALFARLRAARESLRESTAFFQMEAAKPEPLRLSTGSQNSYESPSLDRARLEARLRASQFGSDRGRPDIPAYRLRESRFVPREQYGRAVERSKEMRQARSREASRRQSASQDDIESSLANCTDNDNVRPNDGISSTMQPPPPRFGAVASKPPPSWPSQTPTVSTPTTDTQTPASGSTFGDFGAIGNRPPAPQPQTSFPDPPEFGSSFGTVSGQALGQALAEPSPFFSFDEIMGQQNGGAQSLLSQSPWQDLARAQPTGLNAGRSGLSPPPLATQSQEFGSFQPDLLNSAPPSNLENGFQPFSQTHSQAAPQDHTIQPSQIKETLSAFFGHEPDAAGDQSPFQIQFTHGHQSVQETPFTVAHKAVALADSSDNDFEVTGASGPRINGGNHAPVGLGQQSDLEADEEEDPEDAIDQTLQSYGHANPYAALANGDDEDDGEQSTQWDDKDDEQNAQVQYRPRPDSYQYTYDEAEENDSEDEDSDIEDEEEGNEYDELAQGYGGGEGYEEFDDEDETEEQSEDEEPDVTTAQQRRRAEQIAEQRALQAAAAASAFGTQGNNEDDAIELSD